MKKTFYITFIHVGLQLLYTALLCMDFAHSDDPSYRLITFELKLAFTMTIHCVLGILMVIIHSFNNHSDLIRAHLLGLGFVLLIGGSLCFVAPALLR